MLKHKWKKQIPAAVLLGCTLFVLSQNSYVQGQTNEMAEIQEKKDSYCSDSSKIAIHTYDGETYTAKGRIDVIQSAVEGYEYVLEMQGSLKKQAAGTDSDSSPAVPESGEKIVLTIYTQDGVYGFYGDGDLRKDKDNSIREIEMYGYLVGYYDGSTYTSS